MRSRFIHLCTHEEVLDGPDRAWGGPRQFRLGHVALRKEILCSLDLLQGRSCVVLIKPRMSLCGRSQLVKISPGRSLTVKIEAHWISWEDLDG